MKLDENVGNTGFQTLNCYTRRESVSFSKNKFGDNFFLFSVEAGPPNGTSNGVNGPNGSNGNSYVPYVEGTTDHSTALYSPSATTTTVAVNGQTM